MKTKNKIFTVPKVMHAKKMLVLACASTFLLSGCNSPADITLSDEFKSEVQKIVEIEVQNQLQDITNNTETSESQEKEERPSPTKPEQKPEDLQVKYVVPVSARVVQSQSAKIQVSAKVVEQKGEVLGAKDDKSNTSSETKNTQENAKVAEVQPEATKKQANATQTKTPEKGKQVVVKTQTNTSTQKAPQATQKKTTPKIVTTTKKDAVAVSATQAKPAQKPTATQAKPAQKPVATQAKPAQKPATTQAKPAQKPATTQAKPAQKPVENKPQIKLNAGEKLVTIDEKVKEVTLDQLKAEVKKCSEIKSLSGLITPIKFKSVVGEDFTGKSDWSLFVFAQGFAHSMSATSNIKLGQFLGEEVWVTGFYVPGCIFHVEEIKKVEA